MYGLGRGVSRDYKEAFKWYTLAADQGHTKAKCILAWMYAEGRGTLKDKAEAKRFAKEGYEAGEEDECKSVWDRYQLRELSPSKTKVPTLRRTRRGGHQEQSFVI